MSEMVTSISLKFMDEDFNIQFYNEEIPNADGYWVKRDSVSDLFIAENAKYQPIANILSNSTGLIGRYFILAV